MGTRRNILAAFAALILAGFGSVAQAGFEVREVPLSGERGLVTLDYFAWDPNTHRLWVPAGNRAAVIVIDSTGAPVRSITGFSTAEFVLGTKRGRLGPSSVAIGKGAVYVGNRADSRICIIDPVTFERRSCLQIAPPGQGWAAAPDAIVYVATTKELWVTRGAPPLGIASSDQSITILDASGPGKLRYKARLALGASGEGYAVDDKRRRFYTNLEETGETVAIDVRRRTVVARWNSGCDEARGLAIDRARGFLFVACSSRVVALDIDHDGKIKGSIETGDGLDNIDYSDRDHLLFAAASKAATLTVARVGPEGKLSPYAVVPTVTGARGVVAGDRGRAYVADPFGGRILIVGRTDPSR